MSGSIQLDLFSDRLGLDRPQEVATAKPVAFESLTDAGLIAAISDATLADAPAITAEAGKRRLSAAIPTLVALCNRLVGYGASAVVPEQLAALHALGDIGGQEASRAVSGLITRQIVQGPTMVTALAVGGQLGVIFPSDVALHLLRHPNPSVRSAVCDCVRAGHEIIAALVPMMGDSDAEVAIAAACALGRMGRIEALGPLKRYIVERPSRRVVEALARVVDEEAIVFLARTGRARRELSGIVVAALEGIESPRAARAADALRKLTDQPG